MKQGCQGATVEMQGTPSISHCVETGLVVSGVEATSISVDLVVDDQLLGDLGRAVRVGLAVLDDDLDGVGLAAELQAALQRSRTRPRMKSSGSPKAASGPVRGLT